MTKIMTKIMARVSYFDRQEGVGIAKDASGNAYYIDSAAIEGGKVLRSGDIVTLHKIEAGIINPLRTHMVEFVCVGD